jgi:hypothetical protein
VVSITAGHSGHIERTRSSLSTPVENSSFRRSKIPQPPPGGGLRFRLVD